MIRLRRLLDRLRLRSREPDEFVSGDDRSVNNVDAVTAARTQHGMAPYGGAGAVPPDYIKPYDEGRPRK